MTLEIKVGPPQIAIHQGHSVLLTEPDGQIVWPTDKGLYFRDTRLISSWSIYANGESWDVLNGGAITHYAARIFLTNHAIETERGSIAPRTLSLVLTRSLDRGLHEDIDIINHGMEAVEFNLEIAIRCDFADIFEVKSSRIVRRGRITTDWMEPEQRLLTTYRNQDFCRAVGVRAHRNKSPASYANGRLSFGVALKPGASWHTCLLYELTDGEQEFQPPPDSFAHVGHRNLEDSRLGRVLVQWRQSTMKIHCGNDGFYRLAQQAIDDLGALRMPVEGGDHLRFVPAAGLPWFVAIFGRDSLIASLQSILVYSDFGRGSLEVLGGLQATERDDVRDAEPGKIPHELRVGELAHFHLVPHTPYYGTADATPLYLVLLHAHWRATGDRELLERQLPVAERCLQWIDEYGDRDGDGFQEYQTRSPKGYENQSWKDSGDAVMYTDGSLVRGPKALCELQGYVYDGWRRMAEVYAALGQPERARELRDKAAALFARFNEAFWDEASGFYAYALDGDKKPVLSVASNPGHCLWSGIVPPERAGRVVSRLMQDDMWSGWGIRTLSARHRAYNPYSYQNGSVWPHDNGIIALGFRRYGFAEETARIAHDVAEAASYFALHQLPELYAGIAHDGANFPVQYLGANVPQAWAAGSVFALLQAMLGITPDAPRSRVLIDPALPAWLPALTLRDLRIGGQTFDIGFWRDGEETRHEVLKGDPAAVVRRRESWQLWDEEERPGLCPGPAGVSGPQTPLT